LRAIRTWLAEHYQEFQKATRAPEKLMGKLQGESATRMPKGFDPSHPAADLLKQKQWMFWIELDLKLATSPKLLGEIIKRFRSAQPVVEMLNSAVQAKTADRRDEED
ncbi:MAG: DUF2461 family protein, partial [Acidobacteriota bacterium]